MAELIVTDSSVSIELSPWEMVGAVHASVSAPLDSITDVRYVDDVRSEVRGLRAPGTAWPGGIALGTWRSRRSKSFVAVGGRNPGYVIEFDGEEFARFIVESGPVAALDELA